MLTLGGIYTAGEVGCDKCSGLFKDRDRVTITNTTKAIYNEREDFMDFEECSETLVHEICPPKPTKDRRITFMDKPVTVVVDDWRECG